MEFQSQPFIPVAFGGDINTYSVARAFYEAYKVKTKVYGKFPTGPSYNSKITDYTDNRKMDQPEVMLPILKDLAARHKKKKILAIVLALTLLIAVLPASAFAASSKKIYVSSTGKGLLLRRPEGLGVFIR